MNDIDFISLGQEVLDTEAVALSNLINRIDKHFADACRILLHCKGRIVVTGMGKSGHVGNKIAATLASTGSPAFFVHPAEAQHGDLGMITQDDVVIAISYSGETQELITLLPLIKRIGAPLISMSRSPASTLGEASDVHIDISVEKEACPLGLAPTASTTATMAMGDAIAVALLKGRGFTEEDFARSHPGGSLGRRLLVHIEDVMHQGDRIPKVTPTTLLSDAIVEMTQKNLGMTAVVNDDDTLLGIFTDGDLRRALDQKYDFHETEVQTVMTRGCTTVKPNMLAVEALQRMQSQAINSFIVVNDDDKIVGAFNTHSLLAAGII